MSYNHTYDCNKPLEYFFRENYADTLAKYLNGSYTGGYIDSKLTTHVPSLLNEDFFQALKGDGEGEFKDALLRNSVAGWSTCIPIRLFHDSLPEF